MAAGRDGGGIYLMGYCAEMWLKIACFRVEGAMPADVAGPYFGPARQFMRVRYPTIPWESYPSLIFWMYLLRERRRAQGRPLPEAVDWQLVRRVRRLYQVWWVEMRYRPDQSQPMDVRAVYDEVTWLRDHYVALWR